MSWTSMQYMFADGGTKLIELDHMSRILQSNEWSVTFSPGFVKQLVKKPAKAAEMDCSKASLGSPVDSADPMHGHLLSFRRPTWMAQERPVSCACSSSKECKGVQNA